MSQDDRSDEPGGPLTHRMGTGSRDALGGSRDAPGGTRQTPDGTPPAPDTGGEHRLALGSCSVTTVVTATRRG